MIEAILNFLDIWNEKKKKIIQNKVTPQKIGESPEGICTDSITQKNKEVKNDS